MTPHSPLHLRRQKHEHHIHGVQGVVNVVSCFCSGKFRSLQRGVQPLACEVHPKFLGYHAHFRHVNDTCNYCHRTSENGWKPELNIL